MAWHEGGGDDMAGGVLPGKLRGRRKRQAKAERGRVAGQAYFSSQAATRQGSDDSQKAQAAAFHRQTSLTSAGDRSEAKRRDESRTRSSRTEHPNLVVEGRSLDLPNPPARKR